MDREDLSKIRRTELLARLSKLEQMISEQAARAKFIRQKGWNARSADERLRLLVDSHELYLSALSHLLGRDFEDTQTSGETTDPPLGRP